jgi:hypothetical protein
MSVEAIIRVFSTYCRSIDDGRLDDVAALFAENGTLTLEAFGVRATGPKAIRAKFDEITDPSIKGTHASFNHLIDIDGDEAEATADFMLIELGRLPRILTVGRYQSRFLRVGTDWKILKWDMELRANAFGSD